MPKGKQVQRALLAYPKVRLKELHLNSPVKTMGVKQPPVLTSNFHSGALDLGDTELMEGIKRLRAPEIGAEHGKKTRSD